MQKEWKIDAETMSAMSMEEAYAKLDELLSDLEMNEHSLEETFGMYTQGLQLVQCCHEKIDRIEKKLQILEQNDTVSEF